MKTLVVTIEGMHCAGCAETIKALLAVEAGVQASSVSFGERGARVLYDPAQTDEPADRSHRKRRLQSRGRGMTKSLAAAVLLPIGLGLIGFQKAMWAGLGGLYVVLGLLFVAGRTGYVMTSVGPSLARIGEARGSAALGVLFGLNIPACSAPLLYIDFTRWRPLPHPASARYIEVGWGDRDYYPAPRFNLWYGFKALAWPTPSVLQVVGFDEPPGRYFPPSEVIELRLSRAGFERLLAYITASFEPGAAPVAPSLYAAGAFYPSREKFHLFKTPHVWVARGLRSAGIEARSSLTAAGLMA